MVLLVFKTSRGAVLLSWVGSIPTHSRQKNQSFRNSGSFFVLGTVLHHHWFMHRALETAMKCQLIGRNIYDGSKTMIVIQRL